MKTSKNQKAGTPAGDAKAKSMSPLAAIEGQLRKALTDKLDPATAGNVVVDMMENTFGLFSKEEDRKKFLSCLLRDILAKAKELTGYEDVGEKGDEEKAKDDGSECECEDCIAPMGGDTEDCDCPPPLVRIEFKVTNLKSGKVIADETVEGHSIYVGANMLDRLGDNVTAEHAYGYGGRLPILFLATTIPDRILESVGADAYTAGLVLHDLGTEAVKGFAKLPDADEALKSGLAVGLRKACAELSAEEE